MIKVPGWVEMTMVFPPCPHSEGYPPVLLIHIRCLCVGMCNFLLMHYCLLFHFFCGLTFPFLCFICTPIVLFLSLFNTPGGMIFFHVVSGSPYVIYGSSIYMLSSGFPSSCSCESWKGSSSLKLFSCYYY